MPLLLGIDIGTSGAKALVSDERGRVLAAATAEYPLSTPQPLWSEQDPADWWRGTLEAVGAALSDPRVSGQAVAGIGLTGQMHGAVFLDRQGAVIRPAMLWNDQRTAAECAEITQRVGAARLIELAGNPALTGFQAPKILWLRNHEPENFAKLAQVLLPKDFIRLLLTGERATDAADAAGTLLLDLRARDWSPEILGALDLPREWLPKVYEGPEITGRLLDSVAAELGLPAGLPVIAGGGDNAAAAVGTGVVRPGVVSSSIGTSGVVFAHSAEIALDPLGRLHTFCHSVPQAYHLMGVSLAAGGAFRWLRDVLGASSYDAMTVQAANVPIGAEGLLFLPYLTGERTPHLDPLARGAFVGLTTRHTSAHLIRAVMEGVVYALRDGVEIMRGLGVPFEQIRATGGGGRSVLWRQLQSDIYGAEVVTLQADQGPAYGAALLAGVGVGFFESVTAAVDQCVVVSGRTAPNAAARPRYDEVYGIYRGLYGALRESMHKLAAVA